MTSSEDKAVASIVHDLRNQLTVMIGCADALALLVPRGEADRQIAQLRKSAERASSVLFGEDITTLAAEDVLSVFGDVPSSTIGAGQLSGDGVAVVELLASSGLSSSKGEATRLIRGGGVYVNNRRITDERARLRTHDAIDGRLFVLRKGAKQNHLVKVATG